VINRDQCQVEGDGPEVDGDGPQPKCAWVCTRAACDRSRAWIRGAGAESRAMSRPAWRATPHRESVPADRRTKALASLDRAHRRRGGTAIGSTRLGFTASSRPGPRGSGGFEVLEASRGFEPRLRTSKPRGYPRRGRSPVGVFTPGVHAGAGKS
jgi:hypothetical protein